MIRLLPNGNYEVTPAWLKEHYESCRYWKEKARYWKDKAEECGKK